MGQVADGEFHMPLEITAHYLLFSVRKGSPIDRHAHARARKSLQQQDAAALPVSSCFQSPSLILCTYSIEKNPSRLGPPHTAVAIESSRAICTRLNVRQILATVDGAYCEVFCGYQSCWLS